MSKKLLSIIISFLIIGLANIYTFYTIQKDFNNNTFYALAVPIGSYNKDEAKGDIEYINDNYAFYQLKFETSKLKYETLIKMIWTFDLVIFAFLLFLLKINDRKTHQDHSK